MALMDILDAAQGGAFYANVGKAAGLSAADAKSAMGKLCPAYAAALRQRAEDPDAFEALLELLEDGGQDAILDDVAALADPEVLDDGAAILKDLYGDKADREAASLVSGLAAGPLAKLAALSATSVLAVLAQSNKPQQLASADQPAAGGGGFFSTIVTALVEGLMKGAARSLAPKRRRRRYTSYYGTRRRKAPVRHRTRTPSLDDIFGQILGTRRR